MASSDYYIYYYVDSILGGIIINCTNNKKGEIEKLNTKNTKILQIKKLKYPIFKQNYIRTLINCKHTKENLQLLFDMIEGEDILINLQPNNKIDFQPNTPKPNLINEAEEGQSKVPIINLPKFIPNNKKISTPKINNEDSDSYYTSEDENDNKITPKSKRDNKNVRRSLNLFKDGQIIKHVEKKGELIGIYSSNKNLITVLYEGEDYEVYSLSEFIKLHLTLIKSKKKVSGSGWKYCLYKDNDKWISTEKLKAVKM